MDKKVKDFGHTVIVTVSILFLLISVILIIACVEMFNVKDFSGSCAKIAPIAAIVVSSITLVFSGLNYTKAEKNHLLAIKENSYFKWYSKMIVDNHLQKITDFFDKSVQLADAAYGYIEQLNRKEITNVQFQFSLQKEIFDPFTREYNSLYIPLIKDARAINSALTDELICIFVQFQDGFTERLVADYKHDITSRYNLQNYVKDSYRDVITILMKHETEIPT